MKIVVVGSISFIDDMRKLKKELESQGHQVVIPDSVPQSDVDDDVDIKRNNDLIRNFYEEIKKCNVLLVCNEDKNDIKGYIGGNTFLEIGFAYVLKKKIFILNDFTDDLSYYPELVVMQPRVINGDLKKLEGQL